MTIPAEPRFRHQGCVYGSDAEFLAMAVPFARDGLRRNEPVLVATTAANLELLHAVMGADVDRIAFAEPGYFGRRPTRLAGALHRYWTRHRATAPTGAVRVLGEPARTGGGSEEGAWRRIEAGFNVSLASTTIWLICPYDTRTVDAAVVADACRTHPECVVSGEVRPSALFTSPASEGAPGAAAPPGAAAELFRFEGDLVAVRRHVLDRASPLLRSEHAATMFGIAVGEAIAYLVGHGIDRAAVWVRPAAGRVVCTLHSDRPVAGPAFYGLRHATRTGASLWLTDEICEWLDISSDAAGCTIELAMPAESAAG
ncbi:MEDS domain-containing protein [Amycolatopsis sp. OK19-0408]|uniref:MEDS domain-containing protein n=1 Tax=Amycolatopsis iheyensis TaxID=2945988 RepID=A0A9X2SKG0_9PSEU|nr:MEDS domain-containing protein [Amycolatopsis iheyensis]MCR6485108.1 MEDS domain-containing protein [Amycolatopsis iheyensis]